MSHDGNCWIHNNAKVFQKAFISGNAHIYYEAQIYDNALIEENVFVGGYAKIFGYACIYGICSISDYANIYGRVALRGNFYIRKTSNISNLDQVLLIQGLRYPITITPQWVHAGCKDFTFEEFENLKLEDCKSDWGKQELENFKLSLSFYKQIKGI